MNKIKNIGKIRKQTILLFSSSGKKSLILDLRYVNRHIYWDKIKFDDWKCFENYISDHKGYVKKLLPSHINKLTTP